MLRRVDVRTGKWRRLRSQRPSCRRQHTHRWLALAASAIAAACPSARGDRLYFDHPGGGDFNSTLDPYDAWLDADVPGTFKLPPAGSDAFIARAGTLGLSGINVIQNAVYGGTGLSSLTLDSNNLLSQTNAASVMIASIEVVGQTASATFNLSAGRNFAGNLYVGYSSTNGLGSFNQSGGRNVVNFMMEVGFLGGTGTYALSGGTLSATNSLQIGAWVGSTGSFVQSAGTAAIGTLTLGNNAGFTGTAVGNYNLSGGSLTVNGTTTVAVNSIGRFTQSGGVHLAAGLVVGDQAAANGAYALSGTGLLTVSNSAIIGNNGTGAFTQFAGTHHVNGTALYLGYGTSGAGTYSLNAGTLDSTNFEYVGLSGTGVFNQTGGSNATGTLDLGFNSGAAGTYNLSGGTLSVPGLENVSLTGNGTFNQTGGNHTVGVGMHLGGAWNVAGTQRGTASYNMSAGTLNIGTSAGPSPIGFLTVGTHDDNGFFNQSGGSVAIRGRPGATFGNDGLYLGQDVGTTGVYNLSNGAQLTVSNDEFIGSGGVGIFNQTGGNHFVDGPNGIFLGVVNNGTNITSGTFNLSGGLLGTTSIFVGGGFPAGNTNATISPVGYGNLNITGGILSLGGSIQIFNSSNSAGVFSGMTLAGGTVDTPSIKAPAWDVLSFTGGTLNFNGGTSSNTGTFTVGHNGTTIANCNLNSGAIYGSDLVVGFAGQGNFVQSGGSNILSHEAGVGSLPSGNGSYTLSAGELQTSVLLYVGGQGNGRFTQTGGTVQPGQLVLGYFSTGLGAYNLSGGLLNATDGTVVGGFGGGVYNQSDGVNNSSSVFVGASYSGTNPSSSGVVNLSGGTLTASVSEQIGRYGNGTFNQTGGSNTTASLYLGNTDGVRIGSGTFTLSGTSSVFTSTSIEHIGYQGPGTFNQLDGTHNAATVNVGYGSNATGKYNLSGGTLATSGNEYFGFNGSGAYTQTGGTNHVTGTGPLPSGILFGYTNGASGTGSLSGGTLSVNYQEYVGYFSTGTFTQSGGSNSALFVTMGWQPSGNGTYTLSGGILTTTGGTFVGYQGTGSLWQSGGTHIAAALYLGDTPGSSGRYDMTNGTLAVPGIAHIGSLAGGGVFNQSGGTSTFGALENGIGGGNGFVTLSGGTLNADSVINHSSINQTGGVANFGPVSGSNDGFLFIGNTGGASALMNVKSFDQNVVLVRSTGTMVVSHNTPRVTNSATSLTIQGNGLLDLGNNALLVDNVSTPEAIVRLYLHNGYNADATGIGNWLGRGGITSADAIASHNGSAGGNFKISVGYVNGAYANDPLIGGPIPGQATLPTNRILVRPALYGDFNLDGKVDDTDLAIFSGLGQYNQPNPKFGWLGGDLNHDGKVDDTDLLIFSGAGNYNGPTYDAVAGGGAGHASATPSLTGSGATTTQGTLGDGVLDFLYDPSTGDLKVHYDGDSRITAANPLQVTRFKSAGGHFIPAAFNGSGFSNTTTDNTTLNGTILGGGSLPDGYDFGAVLASGLQTFDLISDLTLQWNVSGGGLSLKNGDVVSGVPEPVALGLIGLGAMGLLARRRKMCRG